MMKDQVSEKTLQTPVEGFNLQPGNLEDQFHEGPVLMVFLRHLG